MASEVDEKLFGKIPEHHLIIPELNIYSFQSKVPSYKPILHGTSTFINILEKDGLHDELKEFEDNIKQIVDLCRNNIDLNKINLKNSVLRLYYREMRLLPWTVSFDTFYELLPHYERLLAIEKAHPEVIDRRNPQPFYIEYLEELKSFISRAMEKDDYIINNCDFFTSILDLNTGDLVQKLREKMNTIIGRIKSEYCTKYPIERFEEIVENGIVFRMIPENFVFHRSYQRGHHPFGKQKYKMMWAGFNFLQIMSYGLPKEQKDKTLSASVDYCNRIGFVSTFRAKQPLKLIDMSNAQTITRLGELMDEKTRASLKRGWGSDGKRTSFMNDDGNVAEWLCDNGYLGYLGLGLDGLHDEVMICVNELTYEPYFEIIDVNDMRDLIPFCRAPYNQIEYHHFEGYE